jgi:hypothetical protein
LTRYISGDDGNTKTESFFGKTLSFSRRLEYVSQSGLCTKLPCVVKQRFSEFAPEKKCDGVSGA